MLRIEIILDQTIEDILLEALDDELQIKKYTFISPVKGKGRSGPRMGDHIWPEENSLFILFTEEEKKEPVIAKIKEMRENHSQNGIALFITPDVEEY